MEDSDDDLDCQILDTSTFQGLSARNFRTISHAGRSLLDDSHIKKEPMNISVASSDRSQLGITDDDILVDDSDLEVEEFPTDSKMSNECTASTFFSPTTSEDTLSSSNEDSDLGNQDLNDSSSNKTGHAK